MKELGIEIMKAIKNIIVELYKTLYKEGIR